jgi:hypothetical protein
MVRTAPLGPQVAPFEASARPARWSWSHGLALAGLPFLLWETWTVVAWLADGPQSISGYSSHGSGSWYGARLLEGTMILISIVVAGYLVRGCVRARRFFTFDMLFCLAAGTVVWADSGPNLFLPTFLASSNWVNLNGMCGHMPFVVNPDCGRVPDPILFNFLSDFFGLLGLAVVAAALITRARSRWPGVSNRRLFGMVLVGGIVADVIMETGVVIPLRLWTYNVPLSLPMGGGFRYPVLEMFVGGLFLGLVVAVRVFKNDRGETLVEQGLERYSPRARTGITLLALYGFVQLVTWIPGTLPMLPMGFYQPRWKDLPAHVINGVCDAPGFSGTRYGPCPASPGYRMPGRHSLPGKSL